jgi:hypothetical protein
MTPYLTRGTISLLKNVFLILLTREIKEINNKVPTVFVFITIVNAMRDLLLLRSTPTNGQFSKDETV